MIDQYVLLIINPHVLALFCGILMMAHFMIAFVFFILS